MGFPKDFLWGAASAAAQIEGGWNEDGRTPSIWDVLYDGKTKHNDAPHVACDSYHKWREDVALMKELGLKSYRFSISWSRVIPAQGEVNEKGIQFYSDLIDALIEAGIEPMITLYHWDLPMWAYEKGGWEADISDDFRDYAALMAEKYGDRVNWWMTFNEPQVFVGQGYLLGANAPFKKLDDDGLKAVSRHVLLAHGKAVMAIREKAGREVKVGFAQAGKKQRAKLKMMIERYCLLREASVSLFVLVDCRHEPQQIDIEFMEWLGENEIPFAIVFTKADKLSKSKLTINVDTYKQKLLETWAELPPIFVTSAEKSLGESELIAYIEGINREITNRQ